MQKCLESSAGFNASTLLDAGCSFDAFPQCNAIRALVLAHVRVSHSHPCAAAARLRCGGAPRRAQPPVRNSQQAEGWRDPPQHASLRDPGQSRKSGHHAPHTNPLRGSTRLQAAARRQQAERQAQRFIHDRRRPAAAARASRTQRRRHSPNRPLGTNGRVLQTSLLSSPSL